MSEEDIASTLEVKDGVEELDSRMMLKVYISTTIRFFVLLFLLTKHSLHPLYSSPLML